jgi:NAD(P)-dependent dehydrogenase (short-subunit alcohol dehydrogenase family)
MRRTVIVGASGGIGAALADAAAARGDLVVPLSRPAIDLSCEEGIAAAAAALEGPVDHLIVASGLLHQGQRGPERDWRQLDPDWMLENYRVNAVLPAILAKHFLPRLARDRRSVFAVLTARVGSIGDNRLGGWHSYRMAKAAANQLVRTLSIELRRKNPPAIAVALHPGTVDTPLSRPFQRNLKPGQLQTADEAALKLWWVIDGLCAEDSGTFRAFDGSTIPW